MIDFHAHLSFLKPHLRSSLERQYLELGVHTVVQGGYSHKEFLTQLELKDQFRKLKILCCAGFHPWHISKSINSDFRFDVFEDFVEQLHFVGELGLDKHFFYSPEGFEKQKQVMHLGLKWAAEKNKPVVLHVVKAHAESFDILKQYSCRGIVHGFAGSAEEAKKYIQLGYKISLGSHFLTRPMDKVTKVISQLSPESVVIESDFPGSEEEIDLDQFQLSQAAQVYQSVFDLKNHQMQAQLEENLTSLIES